MKKLSTTQIILIVIGALLVISLLWVVGSYNGLVSSDETVSEKWANVQTAYQRRADLIPNLVETVKQYSDYEGNLLKEVTEARASIGKASSPSELQAAGNEMNSALSRLLVVAENYPDLKANENYLSLQDELAGTENRIKTERDIYNKAVKEMNIKVRRFPTNIIAGMFGFEKKESFEADAGASESPDVGDLF
ncbi:LemA family protein [Candidatus Woesearchaeota archaeon]|nr:LemA family protein [Candidatus Woesearchaeota archaeon]